MSNGGPIFNVGDKYSSFEELDSDIKEYERCNFVRLPKRDCRSIKAAKKRNISTVKHGIKPELMYFELRYRCMFGGRNRSKSKGLRNVTSYKKDCPLQLVFRATKDGRYLELMTKVLEHNHEIVPEIRKRAKKCNNFVEPDNVDLSRSRKRNRLSKQKFLEQIFPVGTLRDIPVDTIMSDSAEECEQTTINIEIDEPTADAIQPEKSSCTLRPTDDELLDSTICRNITLDQAYDSDIGGDSDADDNFVNIDFIPLDSMTASGNGQQIPPTSFILNGSKAELLFDSSETCARSYDKNDASADLLTYISVEVDSQVSNEDPLESKIHFPWSEEKTSCETFNSFKFNQQFGTKEPLNNIDDVSEYFNMFITPSVLDFVTEQSNLYACQNGFELGLTVDEIKAFFGVLIIMGFHSLPSLKLYWSKDVNFRCDRIAKVFTLRRFVTILRFLHLNNNSLLPSVKKDSFDRLFKVRPLLDCLKKLFAKNFYPSRNLCVDHSTVGFKEKRSVKGFDSSCPKKTCYKAWITCCAASGYLVSFDIYAGHENFKPIVKELSLGENVVLQLAKPYFDLGYCFYFNHLFSSVPLMANLLEKKVFACSTISDADKSYPKNVLNTDDELLPGETCFLTSEELSVLKWKKSEKMTLNIVSNRHDPSAMDTVLEFTNGYLSQSVSCPQAVKDHYLHIGGAEMFNRLHSTYHIGWKSHRWWMQIFYYLFDAAIVNSYIVYKQTMQHHNRMMLSHVEYRSRLASELISTFSCYVGDSEISNTQEEIEQTVEPHHFIESVETI